MHALDGRGKNKNDNVRSMMPTYIEYKKARLERQAALWIFHYFRVQIKLMDSWT